MIRRGAAWVAGPAMALILGTMPGCTCDPPPEPLSSSANLALTQTAGGDGSITRLWTSSDGTILSFRQGDAKWARHAIPLLDGEPLGGVAAASWPADGGGFYERVYFTADDNNIHEGGFDPGGGFSWRARTQTASPFPYSAGLAAVVVPDGRPDARRYVGVIVGGWSGGILRILRPEGDVLTEEFSDDESLKPTSNVFGAVQDGQVWMFAATDSGLLRACRKEGEDHPWDCLTVENVPEGIPLQGDGTAAAWKDAHGISWVSAVVRNDSREVWEARFSDSLIPDWVRVGDESFGAARDTIKAAPAADGFDLVYVRGVGEDAVVQHAHRTSLTDQWELGESVAKPPDIAGTIEGPLALHGDSSSEAPPHAYMLATEVATQVEVRYAFASRRGEGRWHNLLDPVMPTGSVFVNSSYHFTESCADEKGGNILLAAMRHPSGNVINEYGLPGFEDDPTRLQDVRFTWSEDDGHSWGPNRPLPLDFADPAFGGQVWRQGDPTTVVLNPPRNNEGYVLIHELRDSPHWDGERYRPYTCESRIRLYHVELGEEPVQVEVPGESWDLTASGDKVDCDPTTGQFLDHPFMAVGPDNKVHITWFRMPWGEIPGLPPGIFYRMLNGVTQEWETDVILVAELPEQLTYPYIVADPAGGVAYVAWDDWKREEGTPPTYAVRACSSLTGCQPLPSQPTDEVGQNPSLLSGVQMGDMTLRSPDWAFAASPSASMPTLGLVNTVQVGDRLALRCRVSNDRGANWSPPTYLGSENPNVDQFAPNLAILGDGTLVVSFYEMSPPGSGQNVRPMIALWSPATQTWQIRDTAVTWAFDLAMAPHKTLSKSDGFIGDYNVFTGGSTHVHFARAVPSPSGNRTQLRTFGVSESCFLP